MSEYVSSNSNVTCVCEKDSVRMLTFLFLQVLIPPSDVKEKLQKDAYKPKEVPADFDFLLMLHPTTFFQLSSIFSFSVTTKQWSVC